MARGLDGVLSFLINLGFYDVVLPLILVTTVTYALLQKTNVFKGDAEQKRKINAIISLIFGLMFIVSKEAIRIVTSSLQNIFLVLLFVFAFLLLVGITLQQKELYTKNKWVVLLMFVLVVLIFGSSAGLQQYIDIQSIVQFVFQPVLIGFLVFLAVLYYIFGPEERSSSPTRSSSTRSNGSASEGGTIGRPIANFSQEDFDNLEEGETLWRP